MCFYIMNNILLLNITETTMSHFTDNVNIISGYSIKKNPNELHLDLNEFDFEHNPSMFEYLKNQINNVNVTKYCSSDGILSSNDDHSDVNLIDKLAEYVGVEKTRIMLTNGCDAAIKLVIESCKFNNVYIHGPTYRQYERMSLLNNKNVINISENQFMNFTPNNDIVFICSPNQPSGILYHDKLLSIVSKYPQTLFVIDETYIDYLVLIGKIKSFACCADKYENVVVLRSMSKAFGLAGMRIGYIISTRSNIDTFKKIFIHKDVTNLAKYAALSVINNINHYVDSAHMMFDLQHRIVKLLNNHTENVHETVCNFIVYNNAQLYEFLLQHNIITKVLPSGGYRMTIPSKKNTEILIECIENFYLLAEKNI